MKKGLISAVLALLLLSGSALAGGGSQGDWDLGLYIGYGMPDNHENSSPGDLNPGEDEIYGIRAGYFFTPHWSLEGSYQTLKTATEFDPMLALSDLTFDIDSARLNLLYHFRTDKKFRPFVTLGGGSEKLEVTSLLDGRYSSLNAGGGLRWYHDDLFSMRIDARYVSVDVSDFIDTNQANIEATLGAAWTFGGTPPADTDGDGVRDKHDKCPDTPRGATVDAEGCPSDADGDGVYDGLDKCPDTPAGVKVDSNGCPVDSDGDGVFDGLDKCPGTPKGATIDKTGCPSDSDGDGVFNGLDKCPDTPKGAKVDARGCPLDSDKDGVYDGLDKCPGTPKGAAVDKNGCKLAEPIFTEERETLILEGVKFEFDKAILTADAEKVLDRVAKSLAGWPEIRVEVGGHTDSKGRDAYNQTLSQARANAVIDYLAGHGIDRSRMAGKGYGESMPIATNDTDDGRKQNRRVELKKLN